MKTLSRIVLDSVIFERDKPKRVIALITAYKSIIEGIILIKLFVKTEQLYHKKLVLRVLLVFIYAAA